MRFCLFVLLVFFSSVLFGQDKNYDWWNKMVKWDGISSWASYQTVAPGLMGPNALPVPHVLPGVTDDRFFIEARKDEYWGFGDHTQNFFIKSHLPLYKNRISFDVWMVPFEWYKCDTITRNKRFMRTESGEGSAFGDIYFSSFAKLFSEGNKRPSLLLEATIKTASGGNLSDVRYTDAPGYYFLLHSGKTLLENDKVKLILGAMGGFYCWQTSNERHRQNDAYAYGLLVQTNWKKTEWLNELRGYTGYLKMGDSPLVFKSSFSYPFKRVSFLVNYQYGLRDFPYHNIQLGFKYFPAIKLPE